MGDWLLSQSSCRKMTTYICCYLLTSQHTYIHAGLKTLSVVYRDLVEMPVDHSKYKQWAAKPLPANCRSSAHILHYIDLWGGRGGGEGGKEEENGVRYMREGRRERTREEGRRR